jgi:hypothetical protein
MTPNTIALISALTAVFTLLLNVGVLFVGCVWGIAKLRTSSERLSDSLQVLSDSVRELRKWLTRVDEKTDNIQVEHGERLSRIESKLEHVAHNTETK